MKKVPCDFFGPGEFIYFNYERLAQLEQSMGPGFSLLGSIHSQVSVAFVANAFAIGLAQHHNNAPAIWYTKQMDKLGIEKGLSLIAMSRPILKALVGSGFMGKTAYYSVFPEEITPAVEEMMAEEEKNVKGTEASPS